MAISRTVQGYLARRDFNALEDDWLTHLAEDPGQLDYFVGVARALQGSGEEGRGRLLLEILDEELKNQGLWRERLKLLRRAGHLLLPANEIHPQILATLERLYGDRPTLQGLIRCVGLERGIHDLEKSWEKVDRLEGLIPFQMGTVVWLEGKGAGRVTEVNLELESLKVDFEGHPGLTVGFSAASKLLAVLSPSHILRRKLEDPEKLRRLARDQPEEVLRLLFESFQRPLTAAEIRQVLSGIVPEEEWSGWWAAARKHPQLVAGGTGRQSYSWAASDAAALAAVWKAFEGAEPRQKMELFRRDAQRDQEMAEGMARELVRLAQESMEEDPALALEIWHTLDRAGMAPEGVPWSPEVLLATRRDVDRLLLGIEDRPLRERAYGLLPQVRPDWVERYAELFVQEEDPRGLDLLARGLREAAPEEFARLLDRLLTQPREAPATFVWLAERAGEDPDLRERNPFRLFQQILRALGEEAFSRFRSRLRAVCESGGTLPRLLPHLTEEQGAAADEALHRTPGLEGYQRDALRNALRLRFPSLQEAVVQHLYATAEAIEARRRELRELREVEIPANRKAIEEARALGDLRENFEYKAARQRHEYLSARVAALERDLARARPIDFGSIDASAVRIGTRVRCRGPSGEEQTYTILGPWDSQPEEGILSYESDLAQELLGKTVGERVKLAGETVEILGIEPCR